METARAGHVRDFATSRSGSRKHSGSTRVRSRDRYRLSARRRHSAPPTALNTRSARLTSSACMRAPSSACSDAGFVKNAALDDVKKALTAGGIGPDKFDNPFTGHRDQDQWQAHTVRHRIWRQRPTDRGQARRQHEGGRPRSGDRLYRRYLAFSSRSHLGSVGEGDQRAGISERGNPHAGGGIQILDRSGAGGEGSGGCPQPRPAHSIDLPDLEEHQAIWRRRRGCSPACAPLRRRAIPLDTRRSWWLQAGSNCSSRATSPASTSCLSRNPGWFSMFDSDGPKAEATRRSFFDRVIAEKGMIAGYHFGFRTSARCRKDGNGYAFAPVKAPDAAGPI